MGRLRVVPEDAIQYTVHLTRDDAALLDRIRVAVSTPGGRFTPKAEVLRDATAIGLRMLAKELNVK